MVGVTAVGSAVALTTACTLAAPAVVPTAAVAPTAAPAPLKIGVLLPYTESSVGVDIGLSQKRAADLYLKQHDGLLGGRPVNLVYSAESVEAAINKVKVQTLTDNEKVDLLMGGASSETAGVLREAAIAKGMVYVATNATANALTADSKNVFRTSAPAWQLNEPLGEWASTNGHREFYVCGTDSEAIDAFAAGLAKNGGAVVTRSLISDTPKLVGETLAQPVKNVFAALHTDDAEGFLSEWQKQRAGEAGYTLFGPGGLTDEEVLAQVKDAAVGVTTSLFWSPDLDNAENKSLVEAFPKAYIDDDTGEPVQLNGYAVEMWDAMTALDVALARVARGANDTDALIAALEGVSFNSPRGAFGFDKVAHAPVQDIYVRKVVSSGGGRPVNGVVTKVASSLSPG
jgi:branched-chain amino acid transport system substrate-binding protein